MKKTPELIDAVFQKMSANGTKGTCNWCGKTIYRGAYGRQSRHGWHIDHTKAKGRGGHHTNLNNLVPACWRCNLEKGAKTQKRHLSSLGRSRSQLSPEESRDRKFAHIAMSTAAGGALGLPFGPGATAVAAAAGLLFGMASDPGDPGEVHAKLCKAQLRDGGSCRNFALPQNRGYCGVHRR
jgi:hypothetical protein